MEDDAGLLRKLAKTEDGKTEDDAGLLRKLAKTTNKMLAKTDDGRWAKMTDDGCNL